MAFDEPTDEELDRMAMENEDPGEIPENELDYTGVENLEEILGMEDADLTEQEKQIKSDLKNGKNVFGFEHLGNKVIKK